MGSRFLQSEPGPLLKQIAIIIPLAARAVSRFMRRELLSLIPSLTSCFMAVARPTKRGEDKDAASVGDTATTSRFLSSSDERADEAASPGHWSKFLAPRPKQPRPTRKRLRSRFRARHFLKPPWLR